MPAAEYAAEDRKRVIEKDNEAMISRPFRERDRYRINNEKQRKIEAGIPQTLHGTFVTRAMYVPLHNNSAAATAGLLFHMDPPIKKRLLHTCEEHYIRNLSMIAA